MVHSIQWIKQHELVDNIADRSLPMVPIAIVGGHYQLLYERQSDSLRPAIIEEFEDGGPNRDFCRTRARDFPLKTFKLGFQLFMQMKERNFRVNCVLLVNDDAFQRRNFRTKEHYSLVKERGYELRKKYYSQPDPIPNSYVAFVESNKYTANEVFVKFQAPNYIGENFYSEDSVIISERKICKQFKRSARRLFFDSGYSNSEPTVGHSFTINRENNISICLIKDGICSCGGKTFQFYYDLIEKGYFTIFFFVPNDCLDEVIKATEILLTHEKFKNIQLNIVIISNIEFDPYEDSGENQISLSWYTNETIEPYAKRNGLVSTARIGS